MYISDMGFPGGASGKESACQCRRCKRPRFDLCVGKIPWRREWQPTPVFLPGKFHRQSSLVSYSPWTLKESDTTEQLTHTHTHTHTHILLAGRAPSPLRMRMGEERVPSAASWVGCQVPEPG